MNELYQPIETLSGVGEKRAAKYHKLGIHTPFDLLYHFPRTYIDFTHPVSVMDTEMGVNCAVKCRIIRKMPEVHAKNRLSIFTMIANDGETDFTITLYNNPYTFRAVQVGETYFAYGKVQGGWTRREMRAPQLQKAETALLLQPVYPQSVGLTSAMMRTNIQKALSYLEDAMETLPRALMEEYRLISLQKALQGIHRPAGIEDLEAARRRLAFEELLLFQLGTLMLRHRSRTQTAYAMSPQTSLDDFFCALPFSLTGAQQRAIAAITKDLCTEVPMNRLLQGDVGSGKTAVAAAAAAFAAKNGFQTVLMAPTEILARQHLQTMTDFLSPIGMEAVLLTGSTKAKEKREIKKKIADGIVRIVIGTHAVIQQDITFFKLGLVITDEQHRFGVSQRAALAEKGGHPHKLVMSATPIPRTLALIIYGDLDITLLDELPKGRLPIQTFAVTGGYRERAYGFIKEHLDAGEQAYLVCSMIEDSEQMEHLQAAESYAEKLKSGAFADYRVGLLHGKMKPQDKDAVMEQMKRHEIDLLVCTTVVEVGVDVPNATIVLIEDADRFGLAQLHQLRGRVGRGSLQSYCILVTESKNEEARERLKIMSRTVNGFTIAEEDLRMRGPGDFFGSAQHGMPPLMQAAFSSNMPLVSETQDAARKILERDSQLSEKHHASLRLAVLRLFRKNGENGLN